MLISKYTRDVIGALGATGPPEPDSELLLLNKVIAPYPSPPAIPNISKFWKIVEEEDGLLLLLLDDDENVRGY